MSYKKLEELFKDTYAAMRKGWRDGVKMCPAAPTTTQS